MVSRHEEKSFSKNFSSKIFFVVQFFEFVQKQIDQIRSQYFDEAQENLHEEKEKSNFHLFFLLIFPIRCFVFSRTKEFLKLNEDVKTMREILVRYEQILDQKDETEENLCKAVDLLGKKTVAYRFYYQWRLNFLEKRHDASSFAFAQNFYEEKLKKKVFRSWKIFVDRQWKKIYRSTCEKKTEIVLRDFLRDFEVKYENLQTKCLVAQDELTRLRSDRVGHDESIRQAFLRGVCALNMEAMNVLLKPEENSSIFQ